MSSSNCVIKRTFLLIILLIGICSGSRAQDVYFSQFFMNPVYLNPAYAGTMKVPRAGVQYRDQWPGMNKAYNTYFASFDTYLPRISSGIGLLLFNDIQGNGMYTETTFKFIYSKEIRINQKWTMYGSLTAGGQINSLNYNSLVFSDGIDPISGQIIPSSETPPDHNNHMFPDFGTGVLVFNDQYFFGISAEHLAEPDQSLYTDFSHVLPRKYTMHFEVNLPWFHPGHLRKYLKLNPNFIVQSQGGEQNITYGLYANRKGISLGVWNRQTTNKSNDLILMAGFIGKQMKTAISYDMNLHGVGLRSHGSIEVSISYLLKIPGKKSIFPFYEIPGEWDIR